MIQIDMPMPERCGVCFAIHTDEIGLESWCGIDETARDLYTDDINTNRPDWCPLKEQEAVEPKAIPEELKQKMWNALYAEEDEYEKKFVGKEEHLNWFTVYRPWLQKGFDIAINAIADWEGR